MQIRGVHQCLNFEFQPTKAILLKYFILLILLLNNMKMLLGNSKNIDVWMRGVVCGSVYLRKYS